MMEESILSSPCKSKKSIRNVRDLRRSKRKLSVIDNQENKDATTTTFHQLFYQDDGEDSANQNLNKTFHVVGSHVGDFKPFEIEKMLCMADRVSSSHFKKRNDLPQNHEGFLTCQRLTEVDNDSEDLFVITDSELLNCCNEVDEMLMKTPPKSEGLSLINAILKDFSLSPLSSNPETTTHSRFWEYSPEFILKSKPTKTYCRKTKATDCNKRLAFKEPISSDDDDCTSNSGSSLSVQENNSQLQGMFNTTVVPDISERLSENLLNLSAFYTQGSANRRRMTLSVETLSSEEREAGANLEVLSLTPINVVNLLQDICSLKHSYNRKRSTSYSSDKEFHGFPSSERNAEQEISLSEDCGGALPLDATLLSPQSFTIPDEDRELVFFPEDDNDIISCQKSLNLFEHDYKNEWSEECPEFALIKTQDVLLEHKNALLKNADNIVQSNSYKEIKNNCDSFDSIDFKKPITIVRDNHIEKSKNNLPDLQQDKFAITKIGLESLYDIPSTSKDFKKPITIVGDNHIETSKNNLPDLQQDKFAIKKIGLESLYDIPSTSKEALKSNTCNNKFISNKGFQTANGKVVKISIKAQKSVEKLLKEYDTDRGDNLEDMKNKIIEKKIDFHTTKVISVIDKYDENVKKHLKGCQQNIDNIPNDTSRENIGFQTANGNNVTISNKAQKSVEKLLKEFFTGAEQNNEENLLLLKNEIYHANSKSSRLRSEKPKDFWEDENYLANVVFSEWPLEEQIQSQSVMLDSVVNGEKDPDICDDINKRQDSPFQTNKQSANMCGFQTAGGKNVVISAKAKIVAANLLEAIQTNFDSKAYEHDLLETKHNMQSKNNETKALSTLSGSTLNNTSKTKIDIEKRYSPALPLVKSSMDNLKVCLPTSSTNKLQGFQTAGGNNVAISAKAKMVVANLLQDFRSDSSDFKTYEQDLLEIKNKMQAKNCESKILNSPCIKLNTTNNMKADIVGNDSHATPLVAVKRSLDSRSTPLLQAKKRIALEAKQSFTELSVQSPLNTSATKSVISRKNLLSLSKKRKQKRRFSTRTLSNSNINPTDEDDNLDENPMQRIEENTETPIKNKLLSDSAVDTPSTPNINEFFKNAPRSSTPRTEIYVKPAHQDIEAGLKPISWDAGNKSISKSAITTKLSDDSCSNISLNSPNPTATDRIGRLQIYGNAPAISPITIDTHNNRCRPSGLRRTRSMYGKPNN